MKREKEQEIFLLQDDIQLQQNKYVNDLTILETRSSSLVQQRVQVFNMVKFCKEIKDDKGLHHNMVDAKSIRNDIKNINDQNKNSNNTRTMKQLLNRKKKELLPCSPRFCRLLKRNEQNHPQPTIDAGTTTITNIPSVSVDVTTQSITSFIL